MLCMMIHSKNLCLISIALVATHWGRVPSVICYFHQNRSNESIVASKNLSDLCVLLLVVQYYFFLIFQKPSCLLHLLADCLMAASPESHPTTLSPPPQLYPEDLQLKLYQAFIFSIPVLFAIILFLLFYLFYLKRSASATHSPPTAPPILPITLNQPTSSAPTHFDTDLKLKGDLKSELSTVFFDDYLKAKDSLCCVCLGEFQMKEELLQVPACKHVFHEECIRHWLLHSNSTTCPLCRSSIYLAASYDDPQPSTFHPNPVVDHHQHQDD